jgi:hypothetical protein
MAFRTRLCLVTDSVGYSSHTVPERADAERRLSTIQQFALAQARAFRVRPLRREDRGDGQLLLLPLMLDPSTAIPALVAALRHGLYRANADLGPFGRLRIRVSMAQGAISEHGQLGFRGDALIVACRLNEAEPLKAAMMSETTADLGFIVPDDLYRDVIRHNFGSLRAAEFTQVKVNVKEYDGTAWMYLPRSGPVPELSGEQASSMWRTAAAGALVAGLAAVTLPLPPADPAASAHHADTLPGDAASDGWHAGDWHVGTEGRGHPQHPGDDHSAVVHYPHGHDFLPDPLIPDDSYPYPGTGSPVTEDIWLPGGDDGSDGTADPGIFWSW